MRTAHPFPFLSRGVVRHASFFGGLVLAAHTAWAQGPSAEAPLPAPGPLPQRALQHTPLAASGSLVTQPIDWRAAHAAVAQFPRGHADVLRWEAAQATVPATANPGAAATPDAPQLPPQKGHHHGGQP